MTNRWLLLFFVFYYSFLLAQNNTTQRFVAFDKQHKTTILYDKKISLDSVLAHSLAQDLHLVTLQKPLVISDKSQAKGNLIVIGTQESELIQSFLAGTKSLDGLKNQWECYGYKTLTNPTKNIDNALLIVGSSPRGTAYGVYALSEKMGVSPWYWWADVPVKKQSSVVLELPVSISKTPSVKYRGVFLNDEDWGLRPWASKTLEPELGNIGPKTYAKIFELLLRLKANTIWPAMHEGTTAFFKIPGNAKMAEAYQIVVGSSHAEPMLRNNVDEWNQKEMGHFDYVSNRENVHKYWEDRVKESKNVDAIYTIGMRGVHDSKMEGVKTNKEGAEILKQIIKDQRKLLETYIHLDASKVPQAFTIYKEVLELYDEGLPIPEDVTLVWTDDNYGYIRRLSNEQEQKRLGGGGVYYHASYWGRPHDYLWLESTHPALIREEMMKAYHANCKQIWILNVGDWKVIEYSTQLFMDMGYDATYFEDASNVQKHISTFYSSVFGKTYGKSIAEMKWAYFDLAFERKPEFMGWSQTEPTTKTKQTAYNPFFFGDENQRRTNQYQILENQADAIKDKLPKDLQDAYFQLVYYPVKAASLINKKFLYADKANIYGKQGRLNAKEYVLQSENSFNEIKTITQEYNRIGNGKWNYIMDMNPRKLPVFDMPKIEIPLQESVDSIGVLVENETISSSGDSKLPEFSQDSNTSHFVDIFLKKDEVVVWKLQNLPDWVIASKSSGVWNGKESREERIAIHIDWKKWRKTSDKKGQFSIVYGEKTKTIHLEINSNNALFPEKSIVNLEDKVVVYAQNYTSVKNQKTRQWKKIDGLGYAKAAMQAYPLSGNSEQIDQLEKDAPCLEYHVYLDNSDAFINPELFIYALPTLPITNKNGVRVGVQWNDDPVQIIDFATIGRSEEWKQNVLSNKASKKAVLKTILKGKNVLKFYRIDPGVALDYFYINCNKNNPLPYSILPETRK